MLKMVKISRFIWAEYTELLQNNGPERERSILQYIKRCTESDPKRKFVSFRYSHCSFISMAFAFPNLFYFPKSTDFSIFSKNSILESLIF